MYQSLEVDCLPVLALKSYTDYFYDTSIMMLQLIFKRMFWFLSSVEHKMLNKPPFIKSKWEPGAVKLQKEQTCLFFLVSK